jgi:hypothetical protein
MTAYSTRVVLEADAERTGSGATVVAALALHLFITTSMVLSKSDQIVHDII